ncbi:hypothetical protein JYA63_14530 [Fictibacillus nanhaiensis]|uniref:Uncharacterized protein n=1 Tax=Fictibacillus nanhaiensis TaxID=742169 RepID=A0ABS2ZVV1_9BACL|nr:hypothetical protein [Fictibacillus nanhaiensis]
MERLKEKVYCFNCNGKRNHEILTSFNHEADVEDDFHWWEKNHIVKCLGCDYIAFVKQYGDEYQWEERNGTQYFFDTFTVYPEEPKKKEKKSLMSFQLKVRNSKVYPIPYLNYTIK